MKVLITGGAGFIGSHITKQLLEAGHEVTVYDNLSSGHRDLVDPRAKFIEGELSNEELLVESLQGQDAVIDMAAKIEVSESVKDPIGFAENNIIGSLHLFEAMVKANVKKIVFSSTATVYGTPKSVPIKETAPLNAANPYAATKISMEAFLQSYHYLHGFDVVVLRYFNPYGPNEMHNPETHAIPNFILAALSQVSKRGDADLEGQGRLIKAALAGKAIPLYWNGEQVRDFIYVEDLAKAHIDVLNLEGYRVFNVGTQTGTKVINVVKTIEKILGTKLEINDLGERPGDVPENFASHELLTETTGWEPKVGLEAGLTKTIEWFKSKQ